MKQTTKVKIKYILKQGMLFGIYNFGTILSKRHPPVLLYHSIDESGSCISTKPSEFGRQMSLIKENGYTTLSLGEMVKIWKEGVSYPAKAVVLTFDDGLQNNYEVAFPILKKFGFTATIFLTTDYIGKRSTWDRKRGIPELPMLTWEMIREMDRNKIDFQSHTATHPHLPRISYDRIKYEIISSRAVIEENLGKRSNIFCYPYAEYDERTINVLKEEGFIAATAEHPDNENLYAIRRVSSAHLTTDLAFKTALAGGFQLFYSCKYLAEKLWSSSSYNNISCPRE